MNKPFYCYLHTNGELLIKPAVVVDSIGVSDYFESPFVKKWWRINGIEDATKVLEEAEKLEANKDSLEKTKLEFEE